MSQSSPQEDPAFPGITHRVGGAGIPTPVIRGTSIRVRTIVIAAQYWEMSPAQIANQYEVLSERQVNEALAFYEAHRVEIDADIQAEGQFARTHGG
jgi:uncharacterized protein (DUF433 family)